MSNIIIGLTGGIGSGKTTVANLFAEHGVTIVDADIIAREAVSIGSPALNKIAEHFGASFIQADGQLNRSLLRQQIFSNEQDKLWLNNLLHPLIRSQLIAQTQAATSPYCLLVAPLLIENDLMHLIDRLLVIDVSEATQLKRTTKRDGNTIKQVKDIMASQIERADRVAQADDILNNDGSSMISLKKAVTKLHQSYLLMVDTAQFNLCNKHN